MMSCLSLLVVLPSLAQQPTGESATIQALLQEVRALRLTLERSSTLVPRLQLTIARFQDPGLCKQSEEAANGMRVELEQQTLREQEGRSQEADMALQLKVDQAKFNDLSAQLDRLDKQMQRP